ncbi:MULTISPECIES: histidine triad nucleotide-binding protein [Actinoalloteichus]|uniref:HIT family hydrolase, diadenosine tetraphosphate hydrolase n=1 Tax=Actinoalloteichus fjordicus TaxID=1612552 RepID=A0AAC9LHD5_9PSEU|nr:MULTISPECIES: histidine triad nucleotide-binding protein [Actinoalloteichus]APU16914.1 HIT family hydrolase, diadenosine tetraphosphate hydrolase [Actinoalloteichus fjordicus]APU22994.1 HIT family hydrolase, diadenosine tetraphosphate hydrolase [Actinoalloteichus sp. GBA129-24]
MSDSESDCLFCKLLAGELPCSVIRETDTTFAFRDANPQAPTHVLLVPRSHYPDAAALAAEDPALLVDLFHVAADVAEEEGVAESGYRLLFNTGADAGQTVFHAHLHLLGGQPLGPLVGSPAGVARNG